MSSLVFTPWTGGPSPIKNQETIVSVQYRDGFLLECRGWVDDDLWEHCEANSFNDILGYKVITPWMERIQ